MKNNGKRYDWKLLQEEVNNGLSQNDLVKKYGISRSSLQYAKESGKIVFRTISEGLNLYYSRNNAHKHTEETKEKISIKMRGNTNGKHQGNKQSFYKNIKMDSQWEVGVADYLDKNNLIWKYEADTFFLTEKRSYTPDFFLYDCNGNLLKIIEVKGYWRSENKNKFHIFLNMYPELPIEVWDKTKLLELNIVNSSGYLINACEKDS